MVRLRTRDQLLLWLQQELERLNRRSISRALEELNFEFLGGFSTDPPCWIVHVVGHKVSWFVAVLARHQGYGVRILKRIPWEKWAGGKSPLYQGDMPVTCVYWRDLYAGK